VNLQQHRHSPVEAFRRHCHLSLGGMAAADAGSLEDAVAAAEALPAAHREVYLRGLAEEAWLARQEAGALPAVPAALSGVRPFGASLPTLSELWPLAAAVVVVPVGQAVGDGCGVLHLWCVEDPEGRIHHDQRDFLEGLSERLQDENSLRCLVSASVSEAGPRAAESRSWELGFEMARLALQSRDRSAVRRLAADWLVTGAVRGDRVTWVLLGSKLDLATRREWLLPAASRDEVPLGYRPRGGMRFVGSVTASWNAVLGRGTQDGGSRPWPSDVAVLHSFVSTAWGPVVGAALLSRAPRVVLWHTRAAAVSRRPAQGLRDILFRGLMRAGRMHEAAVELRLVDSANLVNAERQLDDVLRQDLSGGGTVLFNVTQGNRLMSFAAHNLARRYPNLWLVYRDNDSRGLDYTAIRYDGLEATTQRLRGRPTAARVDWGRILEPRRAPAPPDWHGILETLTEGPEIRRESDFLRKV